MLYTPVFRKDFPDRQGYVIELYNEDRNGVHTVNIECGPDCTDLTPDEAEEMATKLQAAAHSARMMNHDESRRTKLLYSDSNKNGRYFENVLDDLITDLALKSESMPLDMPNRQQIVANNIKIIGSLMTIQQIQAETMKL